MDPEDQIIMADALTQTIDAAKRVILSLGSGDGSQQASIVKSGHHNIVSTFFEKETDVCAKYHLATGHIAFLRTSHSTVLFEVDAKLHEHPDLRGKEFDIILFTFPHTGVPNFAPRHSGPCHRE
jgi:phospholipid N-methyltransferase